MMISSHKNKTFAALLAFVTGGLGIHRFYLYGRKDIWAWLHLSTLPISAAILSLGTKQPVIFTASPLILSMLVAFIETLVIGLTPDDKWDARHNHGSGLQSRSGWPVVLLLILTLGIGATALFAAIARTVDLLYTGGAYG
jgi:TM2 domain-containing membrane protein YozV